MISWKLYLMTNFFNDHVESSSNDDDVDVNDNDNEQGRIIGFR